MYAAAGLDLCDEYARMLHDRLGDELLRVSLYGSRARGDHRPDSDFDLMVVLRRAGGDARSMVHRLAVEVELDRHVDLSTKILRIEDFEKLSLSSYPFWRRYRCDERVLWPPTSSASG